MTTRERLEVAGALLAAAALAVFLVALAMLESPSCNPGHDGYHRARSRGVFIQRCSCTARGTVQGTLWSCEWGDVER